MKQTWIATCTCTWIISRLLGLSKVHISTARYFHMYTNLEVTKLHALPFILCYEPNLVRVSQLISNGDG
jgi:hypothetical protein